ncbi:MAG: glutamate--tRNA ligase, partial [Chloroflexi bacterium]|nr:glutamate--tRNA ligase [Chloroflexota bacterium]
PEYDPSSLVQKGMEQEGALEALRVALEQLIHAGSFEHEPMEALLRAVGERLGLPPRQFFGTLRFAVTGRTATPPLFETMEVLGRDRVLLRIQTAIQRLSENQGDDQQ